MKNLDTLILKFDNSFNGRLFAVQADTGRVINLQIFSDLDTPVDITGMSLRFYIGNSEQVSYSDGTITNAAQGKVEVPITNSMLAYSGINKAQFVLTEKDGKKVGSKVFDMHIDESIENGATVGKNIVVDFSKIDEAVKLLKDYDKTLQEAKETDLKLKVDIDVATETDNKLKENIELARTFDFDGDIQKAKETRDDLVVKTTAGEKTKTDLDGSIATANQTKTGLEGSISTANSTKIALDNSTKTAETANTVLTLSINGSETAKANLDTSIGKANTAKTGLDTSIDKGSTLKQDIESDIATATTLKQDLSKAVTSADTKKTELNTQIQQAETTSTNLSDTDTKAKSTKTDLEKLLQDMNLTKGQVQEIIASGNLDQYVTDVKLQNELKAYATKKDLQSIDVTSQLGGYAKKTEVPTKLSQLTNDKTFKTETEIQSMINAHTPDLTGYVEKVEGKGLSTNDYTNADKAKVDNIPSNPKYTDTTYEIATQSSSGLMSATDKVKVNNIPSNPKYTDTVTTINGKTGAISKADITALGIPAQDSVYDDRAIKADIGKRAYKTELPTKLSDLAEDSTHRTVTDTEKSTWSGKQDRMTKESVKALGFPEHVVLTQAQYDALSSTQKADTKVFYYIKKA